VCSTIHRKRPSRSEESTPRRAILGVAKVWGRTNNWLLRVVCGIKVEWRGVEKIPRGACIIACKHQSAWETFALYAVLRDAPAGMAFIDTDLRFVWVNPALARMYDRPASDFAGKPIAAAWPAVDAARVPAIDRTLADLDTLSTSRNQGTLSDAADRLQTDSQAMVTAATAAIGGGPEGEPARCRGAALPGTGPLRPAGQRGTDERAGTNVGGRSVMGMARRGILLVPEGRRMFKDLTTLENLQLAENGRSGTWTISRVLEHLPKLHELRARKAGRLSGGEQEMLAIGRALVANPKLVLVDEPSQGLAPLIVEDVYRILAELKSRGTAILLVEQNALLALKIADRAYVLDSGRIVYGGSAADLVADRDRVRSLMGLEAAI